MVLISNLVGLISYNVLELVYDGQSVAICPSVYVFVALFLYTLNWLSSSLFYMELMYFNIWPTELYLETKLHGEIQQYFK